MSRRVRLWTDAEVGFLLDNWDSMTDDELAEALGRSYSSVVGKKVKIKKGHRSSREPWTEPEDDFILGAPGLTSRQVARYLGRAKTAVDKRRQFLTAKHGIRFDDGSNKNPHRPGDRRLLAKTCAGCGLLLNADWFGLSHKGHGKGWRRECTRCRRPADYVDPEPWKGANAKASRERLQAASLPHAVNHGKPWTERDHEVLRNPDISVLEKALRTGRTYYATHSACQDNGYRSLVGKGDPLKGQWVISFITTKENAA